MNRTWASLPFAASPSEVYPDSCDADKDFISFMASFLTSLQRQRSPGSKWPSVLCVVLCVVVLFSVVEGPCKRYAMARHVCQATTASWGSSLRQSVSPKGDCINKMRGSKDGWQCRWNLHNQNSPQAFPHAPTTTPVSGLQILCLSSTGEALGPGRCSAPLVERIPTRCQYPLTLGKTSQWHMKAADYVMRLMTRYFVLLLCLVVDLLLCESDSWVVILSSRLLGKHWEAQEEVEACFVVFVMLFNKD